ncbi:MAG: UDP-N-acetylglucosamine--LPS N-acetylglucosamine transferase [Pseudomonadota bacterium]
MDDAPKVLAIASGGGHFVQLLRLMPAFEGTRLTVATTHAANRPEVDALAATLGFPRPDFKTVTEANRWQKLKLIKAVFDVARLITALRPDVIVTTGAAPGYLAIRLGRLFGARTIWLDSIANAEELSLSGKKAGDIADLWLTQWEHLSTDTGPKYRGSVV